MENFNKYIDLEIGDFVSFHAYDRDQIDIHTIYHYRGLQYGIITKLDYGFCDVLVLYDDGEDTSKYIVYRMRYDFIEFAWREWEFPIWIDCSSQESPYAIENKYATALDYKEFWKYK